MLTNEDYVKNIQIGQMVQSMNEHNIFCHLCLKNVKQKCNTKVSKQIKQILKQIKNVRAKWMIAWFDLQLQLWHFGNMKQITPPGTCTVIIHDTDVF